MKKKYVQLSIKVDVELSEEMYNILINESPIHFAVTNVFKNNARYVHSIDVADITEKDWTDNWKP